MQFRPLASVWAPFGSRVALAFFNTWDTSNPPPPIRSTHYITTNNPFLA